VPWSPPPHFLRCSGQIAKETNRSQIKKEHQSLVVANGEENASGLETALAGTQDCSDAGRQNRGIDGFGSETRKTASGVRALIADRGSNLLSASIAGEDELNDEGFDPLAVTHLAHHRNESGIRRSRFVLSPKYAPPRPPDSFLPVDQMTAEIARSHEETK
jgi:hypothetical protein